MTSQVQVQDSHITWHQHNIDKAFRSQIKRQKPVVLGLQAYLGQVSQPLLVL